MLIATRILLTGIALFAAVSARAAVGEVGDACDLAGLGPDDRWTVEQVTKGLHADFDARFKAAGTQPALDAPVAARTGSGQARIVTKAAIEKIATPGCAKLTSRQGAVIVGATFLGDVDLARLEFDKPLEFRRSRFEGKLDLNKSRLRALALTASRFRFIDLGKVDVKEDVTIGCRFQETGPDCGVVADEISLLGATVGGSVTLSQAHVAGLVNLNEIRVGASTEIRQASRMEAVGLIDAQIDGSLRIGVNPGEGDRNKAICSDGTQVLVSKQFDARGSRVMATFDVHRLSVAQANLDGVDTRLSLFLSHCVQIGASLYLRTAHVRDLFRLSAEMKSRDLRLEGLVYERIDHAFTKWRVLLPDADSAAFKRNEAFKSPQDRFERLSFISQPYQQLAETFEKSGMRDAANEVRYAARDHALASQWEHVKDGNLTFWLRVGAFFKATGLLLLKCLIGYGIGLGYFLILVPIMFFCAVGAWVLHASLVRPWPWCVAASIDEMLPLVTLNGNHAKDIDEKLNGAPLVYIYVHRTLAWIFGSFVLAGLTGITQGA